MYLLFVAKQQQQQQQQQQTTTTTTVFRLGLYRTIHPAEHLSEMGWYLQERYFLKSDENHRAKLDMHLNKGTHAMLRRTFVLLIPGRVVLRNGSVRSSNEKNCMLQGVPLSQNLQPESLKEIIVSFSSLLLPFPPLSSPLLPSPPLSSPPQTV